MSSSDEMLAAVLNGIFSQFSRYFSLALIVLGSIGNLANIIILFHHSVRANSCIRLLFLASLANLISIWSGLIPRMLAGWAIDHINTVSWVCKTRTFIYFVCQNLGFWLITLAAADRWLNSSRNIRHRQISSLKNANIGAATIAISLICVYGSVFYCYDANLVNAPFRCFSIIGFCRKFNDILYTFLMIIPIILMLVFGFITYLNIRNTKLRVHQSSTAPGSSLATASQTTYKQKSKVDYQARMMLFGQGCIMIIFIVPFSAQRLYSTFGANTQRPARLIIIENFAFSILALAAFITQVVPFYIYMFFGGAVFRNALKNSLYDIARKIKQQYAN